MGEPNIWVDKEAAAAPGVSFLLAGKDVANK